MVLNVQRMIVRWISNPQRHTWRVYIHDQTVQDEAHPIHVCFLGEPEMLDASKGVAIDLIELLRRIKSWRPVPRVKDRVQSIACVGSDSDPIVAH